MEQPALNQPRSITLALLESLDKRPAFGCIYLFILAGSVPRERYEKAEREAGTMRALCAPGLTSLCQSKTLGWKESRRMEKIMYWNVWADLRKSDRSSRSQSDPAAAAAAERGL